MRNPLPESRIARLYGIPRAIPVRYQLPSTTKLQRAEGTMGTSGITGWVAALRRALRAAFTGRDAAESTSRAPAPLVWTRLVSAPGRPGGEVRRVAQLTPYIAQTIVEDALRGGRGAR